MSEREIVKLAVVTEKDHAQCLYIDGVRWKATGEITVYPCDLHEAAEGRLIDLDWIDVEYEVAEWPETLDAFTVELPDPEA